MGLAKKLGKPLLHIYDAPKERISNPDSLCLEVQALTDFLRSNKIEVLNVAGPRESKEPGRLRIDVDYLAIFSQSGGFCWDPQKHLAGCYGAGNRAGEGKSGGSATGPMLF